VSANSIKNKKIRIVLLTCGFVIVTILLVLYLYYENKQDVVSQFQQGQLRYAKSMALFLGSHFEHAAEGMPDDIKRLLIDQAGLAMQSLGSKRLWIMDRKGTLLFHPTHEEMVPRNIYQKNERCIQCHKSFAHIEKIVSGRQGTLDYQGGNSLRKIAAFTPMEFGGNTWIVVVDSEYGKVTAFAEKNFNRSLVILGMGLIALILGSSWMVRGYQVKTNAEEEAKRLAEKQLLGEKIRESETVYRGIVETVRVLILKVDREGIVTFMNKSCERTVGLKSSQVIGKPLVSFFHPEDIPVVLNTLQRTLGGQLHSFEARVNREPGDSAVLGMEMVPTYEDGKITGIIASGKDVTEQKRIEHALRLERSRFKSILDSMEDGVFIINRQHEIEYVNPAVEKEFGLVKGRKCYEYFCDLPGVCSLCRSDQVFSGKTLRGEWYSHRSGKAYDLLETPILNENGVLSKLSILHDNGKRQQTEGDVRSVQDI
jgi:PAS domain S-box-containing protein